MGAMYLLIWLALANLVIAVVCGLAAPRAWGRGLCLAAIVLTALPVFWVVVVLAANAHLKESTAGIYAFPGLLLLLQLPCLIGIYRVAYCAKKAPPPKAK